MASSPLWPRVVPFFIWIFMMFLSSMVVRFSPWLQPPIYTLQIVLTLALLWRYRRLTPELNLKFHWSVIPSAILLTWAWIELGKLMVASELPVFSSTLEGRHEFQQYHDLSPLLYHLSMGLRLIGMAVMVPLFEELFIRSGMLRALQRPGLTWRGVLQFLCDLPVLGDWLSGTDAGKRALAQPGAFAEQFNRSPVGAAHWFGVLASTFVFTLSHVPRDWPGCLACGLVWCFMVWLTNRPQADPHAEPATGDVTMSRGGLGLGPVIWSHALVNALLWGYTLKTGDWQFL